MRIFATAGFRTCTSTTCRRAMSSLPSVLEDVNTMARDYESALRIINSRQRQTRPRDAPINDIRPASESGTPDLRGTPGIAGMSAWLQMLGHTDDDINRLNAIHIAGTKGKGSTCAFTEAFLRAHGRRTGFPRKTGLYTSPHLLLPEERIRINAQPLSQSLLAKYFFEAYDRLPQLAEDFDPSKEVVQRGPRYLQLWALLAFHVFIREQVDVVILETHCGGQYDATNIVRKPVVTAISTLGMDHIDMLGPTIENIAWHKAGIFKPGAKALSAPQEPKGAAKVLEERSAAVGQPVHFVKPQETLPLNLKPQVQNTNASLAIAASNAYLETCSPNPSNLSAEDLTTAHSTFSWQGRFQILSDPSHPKSTWYLDAAHNTMSVKLAADWFASEITSTSKETPNVLIFSHINELRSASALLETLGEALKIHGVRIDHVIYTTYDESSKKPTSKPVTATGSDSGLLERTWSAIDFPSKAQIWHEPTIQGAIAKARNIGESEGGMQTLITGSQHLVGPALRILGWKPKSQSPIEEEGGDSKLE